MIKKFFFFFLVLPVIAQAQEFLIKSLQAYTESVNSLPVISNINGEAGSLTIEFDIDAETEPNLVILFKFCDRNWKPYEGLFLNNSGMNRTSTLWFDRLPLNIRGAKYHYKGTFPNQYVSFPFSGKWKFFIVESGNHDNIYWQGKFFVASNEVELKSGISKDKIDGTTPSNYHSRAFRIETDFTLPDSMHNTRLIGIEIVKNLELDFSTVVNRNDNTNSRYYEWNGSNIFRFVARDLIPGNEYRIADIRNKDRFKPPETLANIDGVELSRFYQYGRGDQNGGSTLTNFDDDHAEYMDVLFQIRPPEEFNDKDMFLAGSFTDWEVLPEFKMGNDDGLYSIYVELKRGIYNYKFVTGNIVKGKIKNIDSVELEGNFWETQNEYSIFLYYQSPNFGGYDQIIGYSKIYSRGL